MARPLKNPDRGRLAERINVRLTPEDLEQLSAMAERDGIPIGEWVRTAALGTASLPAAKRQTVMAGAAT
jgi:predicted HicB family RNase H-like nuclease